MTQRRLWVTLFVVSIIELLLDWDFLSITIMSLINPL